MAAQRPNVIVFQEFAEINVPPDIPDLDSLIVGPCYQILDYVDDKEDCAAGEYGEFDSAVPLVDPSPVVIATPPNALPGAELEASSVKVYFDECQAVLYESAGGATYARWEAGGNLFHPNTNAGGADLHAEGIKAGDKILSQNNGNADVIKTIKTIVFTLFDTTDTLEFNTNNVQVGDTVVISNDTPIGDGSVRDGTYIVTGVRADGTGGRTLEFQGVNWAQRETDLFTGAATCDLAIFTASGATRLTAPGAELATYIEAYTTTDFSTTSTPAETNEWRAERTVSDVVLDSEEDFEVEGNQITVGETPITINIEGNPNDLKVSFANIYVEYTALRTDLQKVTELSNFSEMEALLGKYDARNPLFVGAVVAKSNTTTPVKVFGLKSDDLIGYQDFIDRISTERDVYSIAPLTYDTSILAALNQMCVQLADPNYVLTAGIRQKFRVTIGAVQLVTQEYIVNSTSGATTQQVLGTATGEDKKLTWTITEQRLK